MTLRVGHFSNFPHAQALVGHHLTRQGEGWFEARLGDRVEVQWSVYTDGPSAMDSLLEGSLDLLYVGPFTALNAHVNSGGEEVRVVAGAARGGEGLVVHRELDIIRPTDLRRRRIATPQLANTQDAACRAWLIGQGFQLTETGGDVSFVPTENVDQLTGLFRRMVDAVWTVEPWVSQLERQGMGRMLHKPDNPLTAVVAARTEFLSQHADLVSRFVRAHAELTAWLGEHPDEAKRMVGEELLEETGRRLPVGVISRGWGRMTFIDAVTPEDFQETVDAAERAGFLDGEIDLGGFIAAP